MDACVCERGVGTMGDFLIVCAVKLLLGVRCETGKTGGAISPESDLCSNTDTPRMSKKQRHHYGNVHK